MFFLRRAVGLKQRIYPDQSQQSHKKAKPHQNKAAKGKPTQQKNDIATKKQLNIQNKTNKSHTRKKHAVACFFFALSFKFSLAVFLVSFCRIPTSYRCVFGCVSPYFFCGLTAYFQHKTIFLQASL